MKLFLILFFLFEIISAQDVDIKGILKDLRELESKKRGFSKIVVKYDPFFPKRKKIKTVSIKKRKILKLKAILNDKAFINGRWFSKGEKVGEYKIIKITPSFVELRKGKKRKILALVPSKRLLEIKDNKI